MKKNYFPILLLIIMSCNQNQNSKTHEPWGVSQLLEPKLLSYKIESGKDIPKIISIGPGVVIKNSIGIGECRYNENIEKCVKHVWKIGNTLSIMKLLRRSPQMGLIELIISLNSRREIVFLRPKRT